MKVLMSEMEVHLSGIGVMSYSLGVGGDGDRLVSSDGCLNVGVYEYDER